MVSESVVYSNRQWQETAIVSAGQSDNFFLWVDAIGVWQVLCRDDLLIGAAAAADEVADIPLLAPLSRRHARFLRQDDAWFLLPLQSCAVGGRAVTGQTLLRNGSEIQLGDRVRLRFRIPSVLSASARIDFLSGHQPRLSLSGVLLMADTLLLGPRQDNHVCCPGWPDSVVLYRRQQQLLCRSRMPLTLADEPLPDQQDLSQGAILSGPELRFRLEPGRTNSAV